MAAIDMSKANRSGWTIVHTFSADTWQEFSNLPDWVGKWTIRNRDTTNAAYQAVDQMGNPASPETPADGGAVGTHYDTIGAGEVIEYYRDGEGFGAYKTSSLFLAPAAGTTPTVEIKFEVR